MRSIRHAATLAMTVNPPVIMSASNSRCITAISSLPLSLNSEICGANDEYDDWSCQTATPAIPACASSVDCAPSGSLIRIMESPTSFLAKSTNQRNRQDPLNWLFRVPLRQLQSSKHSHCKWLAICLNCRSTAWQYDSVCHHS